MISGREEALMAWSSLNIIRSSEPYDPYTPQSQPTKGGKSPSLAIRSLQSSVYTSHRQLEDLAEFQASLLQTAFRQNSDSLEPLSGSTPSTKGTDPQRARLDAIHAEVDATKNILHKNIEGMVERGERLNHLQDRTEELTVSARTFNTTARKTNRAMWWKNMKWTIAICVLVIIIIAGIIGGAVGGSK
ncbi:hypothetical protein V865_006400 [Kwoniella europaea PYCC6329]|uniref:V-SNARE coiled-coil homology domain-containing protein n=1 Tax=Kwoniella europaea PYCC6329 TaxID=1423913 RepID=A0AAX4KQR1_9TREE